ncbi:MAG TPA: PARP-type zinc finger-containing protein [Polyangiaceae bacterium]
MPDVIEVAKTGRSKCRGCGRSIARGQLRFGESLLNPYAEGESLFWYHPLCAACMRPEKFGPALDASNESVSDVEWLRHAVSVGIAHPRLPRLVHAERAPSGSAHCRHCRELINKGTWRLALQMFEEGRMQSIGSIHAECAEAYFGTNDILDRIERLTEGLDSTELDEIGTRIRSGPAA